MSIVLQGSTSGSITLQEPAVAGSNTINLPAATGTAVLTGVSGNVDINAAGSNNVTLSTNSTERVRVDSSGNVGIGTSSPAQKLHVASSSATYIQVQNTGNSVNAYYGVDTAGGWMGTSTNHYAAFYTNNTERMRITSGGDALIGATNSVFSRERLHLYKNGGEGLSIVNDNNNYGSIFVRGLNSGTCTVLLIRNSADSTVGSITHNGTNTTYGTSSDYRLKENVQPMIGALDKVSLLKPVTYTWKSDGSEGQGFIAHELQEVIPDAVVGEKDAVEEDGSIKSQQIDTSFLVATLTAAIQEQQAQIEELKAEVQALKGVA